MNTAIDLDVKPIGANDLFRARLVSALTHADRKESDRERKRGSRVNLYRLGHYLAAAENVCGEIEAGTAPALAFARSFNPTAAMHRVAKALGLTLDVQRGRWVLPN